MELVLILAAGVVMVLALLKLNRVIARRRIPVARRPGAAYATGRTRAGTPGGARGADTYTSPAWDIPAMSSISKPEGPTGLEQTIIGGGGASGGCESPSCGSDSYSGGDSGLACSSSGGGD